MFKIISIISGSSQCHLCPKKVISNIVGVHSYILLHCSVYLHFECSPVCVARGKRGDERSLDGKCGSLRLRISDVWIPIYSDVIVKLLVRHYFDDVIIPKFFLVPYFNTSRAPAQMSTRDERNGQASPKHKRKENSACTDVLAFHSITSHQVKLN